jgi:hypothetical protein
LHVERAAAEDLRAAVPVYLALELAHLYTSRYNDGRPGPHGDVLALYMPDGQVAVRFTAATYEQDAQRPNRPAKTRSAEIFEWLQRDPNDARAWETLRLHVRSWAQAHLRGRDEAAVEETVAETCARVGASLHTARAETFGGFVSVQYLAARRAILQRRDSV